MNKTLSKLGTTNEDILVMCRLTKKLWKGSRRGCGPFGEGWKGQFQEVTQRIIRDTEWEPYKILSKLVTIGEDLL